MKRIIAAMLLALIMLGFQPRATAAAPMTVIDFEGLADKQIVQDYYYSTYGVTFSGASILTAGISLSPLYPPKSGSCVAWDYPEYAVNGTVTITFSTPRTHVGGYFTTMTKLTFTAYDSGGNPVGQDLSLDRANYEGAGTGLVPNHYLHVNYAGGIAKVVIEDTGDSYVLDDLTFTGGLEFGDAPEGALAYPATGVAGAFPTCMSVTTAGWIQHDNFGAWFGPGFDFETDGNAGLCPGFAPYNSDECFEDGDAGLILPEPYTIQAGVVAPCGNATGTPLGSPCAWAQWGSDIDILIHNWMPNHEPYVQAYVNVLIDWNQDGQWQNDPGTTCYGIMTPEHVLVDFVIPPQYDGTLSALGPPSFQIGPNEGYVWARFSITERPVGSDWNGEGTFEDGETEDYLLRVYHPPPVGVGGEAYPVNKVSLLAPWIAASMAIMAGSFMALRRRKTQS